MARKATKPFDPDPMRTRHEILSGHRAIFFVDGNRFEVYATDEGIEIYSAAGPVSIDPNCSNVVTVKIRNPDDAA